MYFIFMSNIVQKISNLEEVDLSLLSIRELEQLHFEEEVFTADKIKATTPFSKERNDLLRDGYKLVISIMHESELKRGKVKHAIGANNQCCRIVKKLIHRIRQEKMKNEIVYFEAGVGTGLVTNSLLEENNIVIKGCDVYLDPKLKTEPRFNFFEGTIFDALSGKNSLQDYRNDPVAYMREREWVIEDESIDIFYWNDVLEHLLEDEVDLHIDLIHRKMINNGIICTITPSRLVGPNDISQKFCPCGTKAKGFHFHEYSYFEIKKLFELHGFRTDCSILMNPLNREFYIGTTSILGISLIDFLRRIAESTALLLHPIILRKAILYGLGCHITVFRKVK
jgi:hypothetical protein